MTFALFVVPLLLLLLGFPIFMVLLTAVTVALVFFMHVPLVVLHQNLFGSFNSTPIPGASERVMCPSRATASPINNSDRNVSPSR